MLALTFRIESLLPPSNLHCHSFAYIHWQAQGKAKASPNKIVQSQGKGRCSRSQFDRGLPFLPLEGAGSRFRSPTSAGSLWMSSRQKKETTTHNAPDMASVLRQL